MCTRVSPVRLPPPPMKTTALHECSINAENYIFLVAGGFIQTAHSTVFYLNSTSLSKCPSRGMDGYSGPCWFERPWQPRTPPPPHLVPTLAGLFFSAGARGQPSHTSKPEAIPFLNPQVQLCCFNVMWGFCPVKSAEASPPCIDTQQSRSGGCCLGVSGQICSCWRAWWGGYTQIRWDASVASPPSSEHDGGLLGWVFFWCDVRRSGVFGPWIQTLRSALPDVWFWLWSRSQVSFKSQQVTHLSCRHFHQTIVSTTLSSIISPWIF